MHDIVNMESKTARKSVLVSALTRFLKLGKKTTKLKGQVSDISASSFLPNLNQGNFLSIPLLCFFFFLAQACDQTLVKFSNLIRKGEKNG